MCVCVFLFFCICGGQSLIFHSRCGVLQSQWEQNPGPHNLNIKFSGEDVLVRYELRLGYFKVMVRHRAGASIYKLDSYLERHFFKGGEMWTKIVLGDMLKFSNQPPSVHQLTTADVFVQVCASRCSGWSPRVAS